jgi:hypothetical protein
MVEYLGRFLVYFREFGRALGQEICRKVEEAASGVSVDTGNSYSTFSNIPTIVQKNVKKPLLWIRIRICMLLGLPDPHPDKYGSRSGSRSFHQQAKIVRKILISTVL